MVNKKISGWRNRQWAHPGESDERFSNPWVEAQLEAAKKKKKKGGKLWIQAIEPKKGALRAHLGVPAGEKIPVTMLRNIAKTEIGTKVRTYNGWQTVTPLLKKRAVLALTLRKMR